MKIRLILQEGYVSDQFKKDPEKIRALEDAKDGDPEAKSYVKKTAQRIGRKDENSKGKFEEIYRFCEKFLLQFTSPENITDRDSERRYFRHIFKTQQNLNYLPYIIKKLLNEHPELKEEDEALWNFWPIFLDNVKVMQRKTALKLLRIFVFYGNTFSKYFNTHRSSFLPILNALEIPGNINIMQLDDYLDNNPYIRYFR